MMILFRKTLYVLALTFVVAGSFLSIPALSLAQGTDAPVTVAPVPEKDPDAAPVFVPLTNLPGLQNVADSESLAGFFNQLYRLCIGAAAVIAVLQIMRAGALHMFNKGSLSTSQNVRSLIQNSVLGLLLVLSPAIVFGIINPSILNINLDFSALAPDPLENVPSGEADAEAAPSTDGSAAPTTRPQPSTSELLKTEYEWRLVLRNGGPGANGGALVSSIPNQTWPSRGQGIWGARYPNQKACKDVETAFTTWLAENRPNWTVDPMCSCAQPRGEFPQCRQ